MSRVRAEPAAMTTGLDSYPGGRVPSRAQVPSEAALGAP